MKKAGTAVLLATMLSGCGTMMTTSGYGISKVETRGYASSTKCKAIPRVYSGVTYDACNTLLGETSGITTTQGWLILPYLVDGVVSFVGDTVILPYSIYKQVDTGSLQVGGSRL